jgi:hypothetical protein
MVLCGQQGATYPALDTAVRWKAEAEFKRFGRSGRHAAMSPVVLASKAYPVGNALIWEAHPCGTLAAHGPR